MFSEHCIYTIRHSDDLEECYATGGRGQFEERREWKTGKRLLDDAHRSGLRLPIIFAPAENTRRLFAWALLDDILPGPTTRYSFSELRLLADRPAKSTLKTRDGKCLSQSFIRPYAICETPGYLVRVASVAVPVPRRFWICHWQNRLWRDDKNSEYQPVCSSGSNMFLKRGVAAGDVAYVVSLADGYLLLGGRMTIKRIVSRRDAVRIRGTNRLYDAAEWIIDDNQEGTPLNLHRRLAPSLSRELRLLSPSGEEKVLFFTSETQLDGQATRGVRELSVSSAALLDRIIDLTDALPRTDEMLTVTDDLLDLLGEADDLQREAIEQGAHAPETAMRFEEGGIQRSLATRYERDRAARDACIAHHGARCHICQFEFQTAFGNTMAGFIHVHHVNPLSDRQRTGRETTDPIKDMVPLCPNCHAVVHHKKDPLPVEEVRQLWQRQRAALAGGDESRIVVA